MNTTLANKFASTQSPLSEWKGEPQNNKTAPTQNLAPCHNLLNRYLPPIFKTAAIASELQFGWRGTLREGGVGSDTNRSPPSLPDLPEEFNATGTEDDSI